MDEPIRFVRLTCLDTLLGGSTAAWIGGDLAHTRAYLSAWRELLGYATVNLFERDSLAIITLLLEIGVGVETGLVTNVDARRFVTLPDRHRRQGVYVAGYQMMKW